MRAAFEFRGPWSGPLVVTAIHTGHDLRPEVLAATALGEPERFREEDPFTDLIGARSSSAGQLIAFRSRFEIDLNRPREKAVYRRPEDAWELDLWKTGELDDQLVAESLAIYDDFYAQLAARLDPIAEQGPFVVYDVHSYNHRRGDDRQPGPEVDNPEVNVGTANIDRERFAGVVDAFMESLAARGRDVRENVRFKGGHLTAWLNERYPGVACGLALEFKKTFMDEWSGQEDRTAIDGLAEDLAATVNPVLAALAEVPG